MPTMMSIAEILSEKFAAFLRGKQGLTNRRPCYKILKAKNLRENTTEEFTMYEKLVAYASKQLEIDAAEITPDSTFESLGIDSLDVVEMVMDLESELGIELEMEDQKITTFGELADFIDSKMN